MGNSKSSEKEKEKDHEKKKVEKGDRLDKPEKGEKPRSARSSVSDQGRRKPLLTVAQRAIIKYCLENAKEDIAERIIRRTTEKKEDYRTFIDNLPKEQRGEFGDCLKEFLHHIGGSLMDSSETEKIANEFGARHAVLRPFGFKPDFFAGTADSVTTECTFLDAATHHASETAGAWSELSSFVFSAVRDGYYRELRRQRKCSSAFKTSRLSQDVSSEGSEEPRRSVSPSENSEAHSESSENKEPKENTEKEANEEEEGEEEEEEKEEGARESSHSKESSAEPKESSNFLMPPTVY